MDLTQKHCVPCEGGMVPLAIPRVEELMKEISDWSASPDKKSISKEFVFTTFLYSIHFVNEVARIAEAEGHHPDIEIRYRKVRVSLSTHAIGGLSLNDFILAAKLDHIMIEH